MGSIVLVAASVLGIWWAAVGEREIASDPLPPWSYYSLEGAAPSAGAGPYAEPPSVQLLPPADEPETTGLELGLSLLWEIENEPRFFPTLTSVALFPATFVAEGLAWLLLPHSITLNGHTILDRDASREDLGTILVRTLVEREVKFLAGLGGTYVNTIDVELGLTEMDRTRFDRLQSRVIFDSVKRAYKERYHVPSMDLDTLVNTLSTGEWADFLIVPAVVSAYAARYGIDRKWQVLEDLRVQIHVEKATRLYKFATQDHGGQIGSLAINLFKLPVSFIFEAEMDRRGVVPGFAGIGTDLGVVLEAIETARLGF